MVAFFGLLQKSVVMAGPHLLQGTPKVKDLSRYQELPAGRFLTDEPLCHIPKDYPNRPPASTQGARTEITQTYIWELHSPRATVCYRKSRTLYELRGTRLLREDCLTIESF
jgi:hypothetical protein